MRDYEQESILRDTLCMSASLVIVLLMLWLGWLAGTDIRAHDAWQRAHEAEHERNAGVIDGAAGAFNTQRETANRLAVLEAEPRDRLPHVEGSGGVIRP